MHVLNDFHCILGYTIWRGDRPPPSSTGSASAVKRNKIFEFAACSTRNYKQNVKKSLLICYTNTQGTPQRSRPTGPELLMGIGNHMEAIIAEIHARRGVLKSRSNPSLLAGAWGSDIAATGGPMVVAASLVNGGLAPHRDPCPLPGLHPPSKESHQWVGLVLCGFINEV